MGDKSFLNPFLGFETNERANKQVVGGAQKKSPLTGMYTQVNTREVFYIKKSKENPADDRAEVMFSSLAKAFEVNVAECEMIESVDGQAYVKSKCFEGHQSLISKSEKGLSNGWISSNPISKKNKKLLDNKLKTHLQRQDMADILALCKIFDRDPQVLNFSKFTQKFKMPGEDKIHNKTRIGKFDLGWAFADIGKNKRRVINIFESFSPVGILADHKLGGVPTSHTNDWPDVVNSHYFIKSIAKLVRKTDEKGFLELELTKGLNKALKFSKNIKQTLVEMSKHCALTLPSNLHHVNDIKKYMIQKLLPLVKSDFDSLALNSVLLQLKLKVDLNGNYLTPEKRLQALKDVIEQRFAGRNVKSFMPSFDPPVKKLLGELLKEAKHIDLGLVKFCEEIREGRNPSKRYKRHVLMHSQKAAKAALEQDISTELESLKTKYKSPRRVVVEKSAPIIPPKPNKLLLKYEQCQKVISPCSKELPPRPEKHLLLQYKQQRNSRHEKNDLRTASVGRSLTVT